MRYFMVLLMAVILMVAAVSTHSYSGSSLRGEVGIEVIRKVEAPSKASRTRISGKEGHISSRSIWRRNEVRITGSSYTIRRLSGSA